MASLQLGLEVIFYLYPVGLFATLFSGQLLSFRYRKVARAPAADERDVEKIRRLYARIFWCLQLLLTPLLVRSLPHHAAVAMVPIGAFRFAPSSLTKVASSSSLPA